MPLDLSNKNNYDILGVSHGASEEEIVEAYKKLKAKYSEERFLPGEAGNDAAEMLEAVEQAYISLSKGESGTASEEKTQYPAVSMQEASATEDEESADYSEADALLKAGKIDEAQRKLDSYGERRAEWHYFQAVVYYKKNWGNECKKQLEIALTKDPDNQKYKETYEKLCKELEFKNKNFTSGNTGETESMHRDFDPNDRQMGGNECLNSCCQCLACNMLLNCCCNCR